MKKSPIYPGYEGGDYGFDPEVDFSQFLQEARRYVSEENYEVTPKYPDEAGKKQSDETKKKKKSWKKSLFSWWKADKKSNSIMEPPTNSQMSKPRRGGHVSNSGPVVYGSGGGATCNPRRPTSGPLANLFHPTKKVENEIPYLCLDKLDNPVGVQSYGPVYLVT